MITQVAVFRIKNSYFLAVDISNPGLARYRHERSDLIFGSYVVGLFCQTLKVKATKNKSKKIHKKKTKQYEQATLVLSNTHRNTITCQYGKLNNKEPPLNYGIKIK
jgi:hypothetical protein